jgi:hypothetical protein
VRGRWGEGWHTREDMRVNWSIGEPERRGIGGNYKMSRSGRGEEKTLGCLV